MAVGHPVLTCPPMLASPLFGLLKILAPPPDAPLPHPPSGGLIILDVPHL